MARASTIVFGIINIIFLLCGIIMICSSLYGYAGSRTYCEKAMNSPPIILGLIVIVVSLLGLLGSIFRENNLLILYLVFLSMIVIVIMIFTIFIFMVTNKGKERGLEFEAYRVEDFSILLQKRIANKRVWDNIKSCFIEAQICKTLGPLVNQTQSNSYFLKMKLSPLESGCCKPHMSCENATSLTKPIFPKATEDTDCTTWKNEEDSLCFDCNSCKAGFLANLRHQCRMLSLYNILLSVFLMLVYFIGSCARENIKYRYVKYSPYIKA